MATSLLDNQLLLLSSEENGSRPNKIDPEIVRKVKEHIESFPSVSE